MFDSITEWVTDVVDALGYLGVAFLVAVENVFPPIPSEVVLPLAGFVAGQGRANVVGMVAASTVGSMVGAWALYGIAAAIGPDRLRAIVIRWGRILRLDGDDLDRAEEWFDRRSSVAVLIGRCVPLIRSLVSIPAGFRRMPLLTFSVYTLIGSLVWNSALVGAGYALGDRWEEVGDYVGYLQYVVIAAVVIGVAWFAWSKFGPGRDRAGGPGGGTGRHTPAHMRRDDGNGAVNGNGNGNGPGAGPARASGRATPPEPEGPDGVDILGR